MPTAYTILFLLLILVAAATWIIPAGSYDYVDGVPVAGTYHTVEQNPQGVGDVLKAAFSGFYDAVDVCIFILMVGGFLGVVMKTGAVDAGVGNVIRLLGGREKWLIPILMIFFGLGGMPVQPLVEEGGAAVGGFLAITMMEQLGGGWGVFALVFGVAAILCAIGTCLLGFWLSTVRLLYAMGENNFLPKVFAKVNKNQQPLLPNVFLLVLSLVFIVLQNSSDFMSAFFNLMSFGCACAYAITMISAMRIHKNHPELVSPYKLKGGNFTRMLALIISVVIAFFCTLGQGIDSWICFGVYLGVGVVIWLWMVCVNWKKHPVEIETPDGIKTF